MYFYDPSRGRRRRALVRDRAVRIKNQSDDFLEKAARDLRNRARGALAEATALMSDQQAPDWILEERIRAELGRVSSHSRAIEVAANAGRVTLHGPVLADEADRFLSRAGAVRGVRSIDNQLDIRQSAEDLPGLQGIQAQRDTQNPRMQEYWSPSTRLLVGIGGGLLAVYGRARRGFVGSALSLAGLGLLARGVANIQVKRLFSMDGDQQSVQIQKAINIDSPVERVYDYWTRFENFPRFMSHVKEIWDHGDGRSHWIVSGPAGVPVEFDAMTTKMVPNEMIAWSSLPDQPVKTMGSVRFDRNEDQSTRVTVRMGYTPPAGVLGHAVASLFGSDPKNAMDEDLARLKTLLEQGKTSSEGRDIRAEDLPGDFGEDQA
jgi:uncharacterized membrane protein